ncbi:act-domain containing protein kinase family protein-related [Anaeramoeba ignava]|uniref:Act-domain containing protein kinase family protein-related n=1 Tax=Anaeramoeba ignava TaxID=1746090 RepID=A0A9Q0RB65_ANAIG|nr:act-domain containing protein kinase family protein-related [Anaeramoeba ignava]
MKKIKLIEEKIQKKWIPKEEISVKSCLGKKVYGLVNYGKWKSQEVAIGVHNIRKMKMDELNKFIDQIKILQGINHENIINFFGVSLNYPEFWVVNEFYPRKSIYNYLFVLNQKPSRVEQVRIALEIAQGIMYLHTKKIIHQSIRDQNIFLDRKKKVKLGNFGMFTTQSISTQDFSNTRDFYWMAPEFLQSQDFSFPVDIFSFGMILYEISTLQIPFQNETPMQIPSMIISGIRPFLSPDNPFADIIQSCWDGDPEKRLVIKKVLNSLLKLQTKWKNQNPESIKLDVN